MAEVLSRSDLPADLCDTAEVVVAEALNNVVEHAYAESPDGWIYLDLRIAAPCLFVCVRDRGGPMPGLTPPDGKTPSTDVPLDDLPEGGFGWFLLHTLTQDLTYSRTENCNKLTFRLEP